MKGLYSFLLSIIIMLSFSLYVSGLNVLIVDAAAEPGTEFLSLSGSVQKVQGEDVVYTQTLTANLAKDIAGGFDIVWLGWNATSDDGAYNRANDGDAISDYVEAGGALLASASDNNGWKSDWLPAAVTVLDTGDYDLDITDEGKELFSKPNSVKSADPIMDEGGENFI